MGITGSDREEAFSEGLVAITVAAQKFDPSRNVPLANWLGKNIRWDLQNWRENQRKRNNFEAPHEVSQAVVHNVLESNARTQVSHATVRFMGTVGLTSVAQIENHLALREAFFAMEQILSPLERNVLLLVALEIPGVEIAGILGISTVAVSRTKKKAQAKMREALL